MWPLERDKAAYLPIDQTAYGYAQRASFTHADLHHEYVVDMDSPFAAVVPSDTASFHFLLLGDQNAGKSTFLHAWTFEYDPSFSTLVSELPVLSSAFVNARFLSSAVTLQDACDQPPFIDTDVARTSVLLTSEDLVFWLRERNLAVPELLFTSVYSHINLHEIGGDHLDRLMNRSSEVPHEILQNSLTLLKQTTHSVYFVNAADLFLHQPIGEETELRLHSPQMRRILTRLEFLLSIAASDHKVTILLTRLPPQLEESTIMRDLLLSALESSSVAPCISAVICVPFLLPPLPNQPWPPINPESLLSLLALLMGSNSSQGGPLSLFAGGASVGHLLLALQRCHQKLSKGSISPLWITETELSSYLEHNHDLLSTVPAAQLLSCVRQDGFGQLSRLHTVIMHDEGGFSDLCVQFWLNGSLVRTWKATSSPCPREPAVRFPVSTTLWDAISRFQLMDLPTDLWVVAGADNFNHASENEIASALLDIEAEISRRWGDSQIDNALFLLLEEWVFAKRILSRSSASPLVFPLPLAETSLVHLSGTSPRVSSVVLQIHLYPAVEASDS